MQLLKNPMILMAIVGIGITFGMPKLMENMDPEMKAEYEDMQRKTGVSKFSRTVLQGSGGGSATAPGEGFDLAGYLAGASAGGGDGPARRR